MATTTTDTTPFQWGQGGERLTPEQIKTRRDIVNALVKNGTDYSPIQHWTQGLNRVAQALLGGYEAGQLDRAEKANTAEDKQLLRSGLTQLFAGDGSTPTTMGTPGASGTPGAPAPSTGGGVLTPTSSVVPGDGGGPQAGSGLANSALDLIMKHESAGKNVHQNVVGPNGGFNPSTGTVTGPSSASGYFQMIKPTWRTAAGLAGIDTSQYPTAISAPYEVQRKAAAALFARDGFSHWAPYNAALRGAIAKAGGPGAFVNDGMGAPASMSAPIAETAPATPPVQGAGSPAAMGGGAPALNPWSQEMMAGAIRNSPDKPITMFIGSKEWEDNKPFFTGPNGQPLTVREAAAKMQQPAAQGMPPVAGSPPNDGRVRLAAAGTSDMPVALPSPTQAAAQNMPAGDFLVRQAQSRGGVAPQPAAPAAAPPATAVQRVAQALQSRGSSAAIDMLSSPAASEKTQLIGRLLLQKELEARKPETYSFQTIGGRLYRTGNRGSIADTGLGDTDKPTFGVIGKDEFGREQYGFIDQRKGIVTPYNPAPAPSSGPSTIPPVPAGVDPKAWRDAHSKAAAEGSATGNFDQEAKLRAEYNKNLGTFADVHDAFGRVIASTQGRSTDPNAKSPAADISLVFGFMKMLDPGSVVREGEYATAKNAAGIPDRIVNTYNKLLTGEFLSAEQRQDFVNQAQRVYGQARRKAEETASVYRTLSKGYGVDAARVVTMPEALTAPVVNPATVPGGGGGGQPAPGPAPGAGQVARPTTDAEFNALPRGSYYVDPDDGRTYRKP